MNTKRWIIFVGLLVGLLFATPPHSAWADSELTLQDLGTAGHNPNDVESDAYKPGSVPVEQGSPDEKSSTAIARSAAELQSPAVSSIDEQIINLKNQSQDEVHPSGDPLGRREDD